MANKKEIGPKVLSFRPTEDLSKKLTYIARKANFRKGELLNLNHSKALRFAIEQTYELLQNPFIKFPNDGK
jgi:hypothetical protein